MKVSEVYLGSIVELKGRRGVVVGIAAAGRVLVLQDVGGSPTNTWTEASELKLLERAAR